MAHRYNAACAALLLATGTTAQTIILDPSETARLKHQALLWLDSELAACKEIAGNLEPKAIMSLIETLEQWLRDSNLASLRGDKQIKQLPDEDQQVCRKLWTEHRELVERLRLGLAATKGQ